MIFKARADVRKLRENNTALLDLTSSCVLNLFYLLLRLYNQC